MGATLFAEPILRDWRLIALMAAMAFSLLLGAAVLAAMDRWRKRQANVTLSAADELASYRALYERGELSADEYQRLRLKLADRLKPKAPPPKAVRDPETGMVTYVTDPAAPAVAPPKPTLPDAPPSPPDLPPSSDAGGG